MINISAPSEAAGLPLHLSHEILRFLGKARCPTVFLPVVWHCNLCARLRKPYPMAQHTALDPCFVLFSSPARDHEGFIQIFAGPSLHGLETVLRFVFLWV